MKEQIPDEKLNDIINKVGRKHMSRDPTFRHLNCWAKNGKPGSDCGNNTSMCSTHDEIPFSTFVV